MEQKRSMLFTDLDEAMSMRHIADRNAACAAMGLPLESPPNYEDTVTSRPANCDWSPTMTVSAAVHNNSDCLSSNESTPQFRPALPIMFEQLQPTTSYFQRMQQQQQQQQPQQPQQQPQPQPQPQPQQQATLSSRSVIESFFPQLTLMPQPKLGPNPCMIACPACGAQHTTRMIHTPNSRTHICAVTLCIVGWCCCACCLPYLMKSCRTGNHYCVECNTFLGAYYPYDKQK